MQCHFTAQTRASETLACGVGIERTQCHESVPKKKRARATNHMIGVARDIISIPL